VEFHITDHTPGFDWPAETKLPEPDAEHGRGLFIIHSLMDGVTYLRGNQENRLILRKTIATVEQPLPERGQSAVSQDASPSTPSASELHRRVAMSEQATAAMAKELCFRSEALHAIFRCSSELGRGNSVEDFADRLLGDLLRIAEADWFVLRIVSPDHGRLEAHNISKAGLRLEAISLVLPDEGSEVPNSGQAGDVSVVELRAAWTKQDVWFGGKERLADDDPLGATFPNSAGFVRPILSGDRLLGTLAVGCESRATPFSPEQIEVIRTFCEFLAIQIVNADLQRKQVDVQLTAHELEIARNIQESLLPKYFPVIPGFGLGGFCLSARHVGGDFYDVLQVARDRVLLVVADVMGKGIPAALFAATLHTLIRTMVEWSHQPAELLDRMNGQMFEELSAVDMFITVQLVLVDTEKQVLTVASAGHCPLLVKTKSGQGRSVAPEGLPLGILPRAIFTEETIPLDNCSSVLLYTDGLTEARNAHGEFFGQQRLERWLQQSTAHAHTAYELSWKFMADIKSFQARVPVADDQTFLILTEETPNASEIPQASNQDSPVSVPLTVPSVSQSF
jgi:serine phosphatase RsbU (regulator of sigma subunit)